MSGFSAAWLALREPADAAARALGVTDAVVQALAGEASLRIVDLGCGAGSNLRFLAPRLPRPQRWLLVDNDQTLLDVAAASATVPVDVRVQDLACLDPSVFAERHLVTASALLDLVSEAWVSALVEHCRAADAHVLFALNYDGRFSAMPADPDDELIRAAVNRHQQGDKGFGPALGSRAGERTAAMLAAAGYDVRREPSDWRLGSGDAELQRQLAEGLASAAIEIVPSERSRVLAWCQRRLRWVNEGVSMMIVGHDDVAGLRPAR